MTDADDLQPQMATYVLLTDTDNATVLVRCPDEAAAQSVAAAATMSDGDVSAWRVPAYAVTDHDTVARIMRDGGNCNDVHDAGPPASKREAA